jgi:hypothetical protein
MSFIYYRLIAMAFNLGWENVKLVSRANPRSSGELLCAMMRRTNYIPIDRNAIEISGFGGNKTSFENEFPELEDFDGVGKPFRQLLWVKPPNLVFGGAEKSFELCRYAESRLVKPFSSRSHSFTGDGKHLMMSNRRFPASPSRGQIADVKLPGKFLRAPRKHHDNQAAK